MQLIRGLPNLRAKPLAEHGRCVATVGNYDGVHLGHQAVLSDLAEQSRAQKLPMVAVVFEPTPAEFFAPEHAPARLTRLVDKLPLFALAGVHYVLSLRFNTELAQMPPEQFVKELLVDLLGVKQLAVGDDFKFGRDRAGDFAFLQEAGQRYDFAVSNHATEISDGERISSTRIRAALAEGEMGQAAAMLGRPYRISGRVTHGDALGRTIGFPTANIPLRVLNPALSGVFVVMVHGLSFEPRPAVANVGKRPTVNGQQARLEVHLLDYSGDLYGQRLEVSFWHRLRAEQRFDSVEALRQQIELDVVAARAWFAEQAPSSPPPPSPPAPLPEGEGR